MIRDVRETDSYYLSIKWSRDNKRIYSFLGDKGYYDVKVYTRTNQMELKG